jgi:BolA protein
MNINDLIQIIEKKLSQEFSIENIKIEDKSFLHKKHKGFNENKFHLKLTIASRQLADLSRIESNKKIFKILNFELKEYIHSIQILIR